MAMAMATALSPSIPWLRIHSTDGVITIITVTIQISVVIYREMQRLEVVNGVTGISQ
jgi:hypothetical protein